MATLAQARTRWVQENPINSPGYEMSPADYTAMADNRATLMLDLMNQEEADAARIVLRKKYKAAKATLDVPVGSTAAQVRQNVIEHRAILSGLIEILKDAGFMLDGNGV